DVPVLPSHVAVIVAEPVAMPETRPFALTVATAALLLVHDTARPVRGLPAASFGVPVSWAALPTATLTELGATATEATEITVTVMAAVPLCPSQVAVMVAEPAATAVTSPWLLTVAAAVLLLDQAIVRPIRAIPFASFGVAVS